MSSSEHSGALLPSNLSLSKKNSSWEKVTFPSTTLFCLTVRVKSVRDKSSLEKMVLFDIERDWEVQRINCYVQGMGWWYPTAILRTWPLQPQCPTLRTQFPLLIQHSHFQHVVLGKSMQACTDCWPVMLASKGPANNTNFTSPQLQNRYEQVLCWQLELQLYFIYSSIRTDVAVIQRFSQP